MSKVTVTPEMTVALELFRKKLRLMREHYGLSRPKFAELLGIPPTTLKNYELGYRTASLELLININAGEFARHVPWLLNPAAEAKASGLVPVAE